MFPELKIEDSAADGQLLVDWASAVPTANPELMVYHPDYAPWRMDDKLRRTVASQPGPVALDIVLARVNRPPLKWKIFAPKAEANRLTLLLALCG